MAKLPAVDGIKICFDIIMARTLREKEHCFVAALSSYQNSTILISLFYPGPCLLFALGHYFFNTHDIFGWD